MVYAFRMSVSVFATTSACECSRTASDGSPSSFGSSQTATVSGVPFGIAPGRPASASDP